MAIEIEERVSQWSPRLDEFVSSDSLKNYPDDQRHGSIHSALTNLDLASFAGHGVEDENSLACCHSGLWLLHHYLDESHQISQSVDTPEGSWWHAIMHRLEGDFGNSKYWYRRVGSHPCWEANSLELTGEPDGTWSPFDYVDQCRDQSISQIELRRTAQMEWLVLFEHCWNLATGTQS